MLWSLICTDILDRILDEQGWPPEPSAKSYSLLLRSAFVVEAPTEPPSGSPYERAGESPA